jgi:autotransporter-associated beta strand protein
MTIGGGVLLTNTGSVRLSGNNSVAGGWTLNGTGQLVLDSADALGSSGAINFNAGILVATANNTTDYSSRFTLASSGNYALAAQSGVTLSIASALVGNGTSGLRVGALSNTGTIILTNASNSFNGSASLNSGTLSVEGIGNAGSNSYLGKNATILIGSGTLSSIQAGVKPPIKLSTSPARQVAQRSQTTAAARSLLPATSWLRELETRRSL